VAFLIAVCLFIVFDSNFSLFFDIPSAIIVIVFPLIFMGILHGWKNIGTAFSILSDKIVDKMTLLNAKTFFENYGKTIFSISFVAFIIAFVAIMKNLENIGTLGPNMAAASIVLLYAGIMNMVIIIPYKIIIRKKMMEIEK
jgi:flagellar motor component MotA